MSNERIDLTQFEGLTTPWDFHAKYLHIESAKVAIKLLAELKRCYERIDRMAEELACWWKVIELFDPKSNNPELSAAISEAFGHEH